MGIKAVGFKLTQKDYSIALSISRILGSGPALPVEVCDLASFIPETTPEDIIIVFGDHAQRLTNDMVCSSIIKLPSFKYLEDIPKNKITRKKTYDKLLGLSTTIEKPDQETFILEEDLPAITSNDVLKLEETLRAKGIISWEGLSKNGRLIKLTTKPETGTADINLTFAELYSLKAAMESLQVTSFKIYYKKTGDEIR